MTMTHLTLTRPDDWHLHLRDGEVLASVPRSVDCVTESTRAWA